MTADSSSVLILICWLSKSIYFNSLPDKISHFFMLNSDLDKAPYLCSQKDSESDLYYNSAEKPLFRRVSTKLTFLNSFIINQLLLGQIATSGVFQPNQ